MVDGLLQIAELELSPLNPVGSMGPFGGGREGRLQDHLGTHPGEVPCDFGAPGFVTDGNADPADVGQVGHHELTAPGVVTSSP